MRVWRLCRESYAATAFSGEGAQLYGGRWNPIGVPMVYTSSSLSLALVEVFVNMDGARVPDDFVSILADLPVPEASIESQKAVTLAGLPANWRELDNPAVQEMGAAWARSRQALTMLVPSVAVDGEWNVLVNPSHADASAINIEKPKPFRFDPRMFKGSR